MGAAVRFEADRVVRSVEIGVRHGDVFAVDDVEAVVVPVGIALDVDAVDLEVFALIVGLHPAGRVFQADAFDRYAVAFAEVEDHRADAFVRAVESQPVVDQSAVDQVHEVIGGLAAAAVDQPFARHADVFLPPGQQERGVQSRFAVVVVGVVRAEQHGAALQVQRYAREQVQRPGDVAAQRENQLAASFFMDDVNRTLERTRVEGGSVGHGPEVRNPVIFGPQLYGTEQGERQREDCCFSHHFVCFAMLFGRKCVVSFSVFRSCRTGSRPSLLAAVVSGGGLFPGRTPDYARLR